MAIKTHMGDMRHQGCVLVAVRHDGFVGPMYGGRVMTFELALEGSYRHAIDMQ